MVQSYCFRKPGLLLILLLLTGSVALAADQAAGLYSPVDWQAIEEAGLEPTDTPQPAIAGDVPAGKALSINTIPQDSVLLIPNSTADDVGMYDPFDGHFLGILLTDTLHLSTPNNAIQGPDGNIYLSEQLDNGVFVYDTSGAYLYTYCDGTDGLNNVRGIDFRNDTLFVTSGDDYVAMFNAPHNRLANFIADGSDPFDIHFLDDGRALLADIQGTTDNVRLYDVGGTLVGQIFSVNFPEQVIYDNSTPGDYLNASFSANVVTDFDLDGTIHQTTAWSSGRGVYRLGNGNLLVTNSSGVFEIEPGTGNIVEQKNTGSGRFIELFVVESGPAPVGRCCYDDSLCADNLESECTALNGTWDETLNCIGDPCPIVGYLVGTVTDSNTTSPIEGAIVTASSVADEIVVDTTDASGNYYIVITPGTINVTVEAVGYVSDSQDVTVIENQTTTHDVALTAPIATIDTSPVIDTVATGDTAVYSMFLYNVGTAPLDYDVTLEDTSGAPATLNVNTSFITEKAANSADSKFSNEVSSLTFKKEPLPVILDVTWMTVTSGQAGSVAPGDSALIEFLVDFRYTTLVNDTTYEADANINNNSADPTPVINFSVFSEQQVPVYAVFGPFLPLTLTQSFDPISPQITAGAISSPADVVIYDSTCASTILWPNEDLGLPDYANIDAFSDGLDMVSIDVHGPPPNPNSYIFVRLDISVDRSTTGRVGSLVESEVLTDGASGDTYEKN